MKGGITRSRSGQGSKWANSIMDAVHRGKVSAVDRYEFAEAFSRGIDVLDESEVEEAIQHAAEMTGTHIRVLGEVVTESRRPLGKGSASSLVPETASSQDASQRLPPGGGTGTRASRQTGRTGLGDGKIICSMSKNSNRICGACYRPLCNTCSHKCDMKKAKCEDWFCNRHRDRHSHTFVDDYSDETREEDLLASASSQVRDTASSQDHGMDAGQYASQGGWQGWQGGWQGWWGSGASSSSASSASSSSSPQQLRSNRGY